MTSTNEPAGVWVRVSTGGQDEAQQVPAVEEHCEKRGYRIERRYELNDKSASKGEQQAKLDEMLADMREGTIKVLVCWRSNRLERRGPEALFKLLRQVKDAGGRIESTSEPLLGFEDMSGQALTALGAVVDSQLAIKISEDTTRAIRQIQASGHIYNGNPPWGFEIIGPKYGKTIRPTELCRKYVPQVFDRCIAGQSLRTIAAWLDSEGVPTRKGNRWNEGTVRWIIRTRAHAGRLLNGKGETVLDWTTPECKAVISPGTFDRANWALKDHPKRGPAKNPPLLAALRCNRCGSPMYRVLAGKAKRLYYRCYGSGPQRKGCGNMVLLEHTDTIIAIRVFLTSTDRYQTREWAEGKSYDDEISNVKQDIREAVEAERFEEMPALQAQLAEYRRKSEEETSVGHWEYTDTEMTVGDHFYGLDDAGKREYLKRHDIRVEKDVPDDPGATKGVRVVIDGVDHGVFLYPVKA
jgi:site-specific DNA recombinase